MIVGNIYSKSSWSNLSDFVGSTTGFSTSGGKIISAESGTRNTLGLPAITALDRWKLSVRFKWLTNPTPGGNYGIKIGSISVNTHTQNSVLSGVGSVSDGNFGKPYVQNVETSDAYYGSSALPLFEINDVVLLELEKFNSNSYRITVNNETKGTTVQKESLYEYNTFSPAEAVGQNTGRMVVTSQGGSYEISFIQFESDLTKHVNKLFVGDSLTAGFMAGSSANRYAIICGGEIQAGGGDTTEEVLLRIPEVIDNVLPKRVFMMIGTNDLNFGVSAWQTNYQNIVTQLEDAGIGVVKICPAPNNGHDMSVVKTFLESTYPGETINCYTPLKASSGTGIDSAYDAGDGTHINEAGNALLASTIIASPLFPDTPISTSVFKNVLIQLFQLSR